MRINQNVLSISEINGVIYRLLTDGKVRTDAHRFTRFVYDLDGNVLGGVVWTPRKVRKYGAYGRWETADQPCGYLHS